MSKTVEVKIEMVLRLSIPKSMKPEDMPAVIKKSSCSWNFGKTSEITTLNQELIDVMYDECNEDNEDNEDN